MKPMYFQEGTFSSCSSPRCSLGEGELDAEISVGSCRVASVDTSVSGWVTCNVTATVLSTSAISSAGGSQELKVNTKAMMPSLVDMRMEE